MKGSKIILAVLILSLIALIFSGCGGGWNPVIPSPEPEPDTIPEIELEEEKSDEIIFEEDFSIELEGGLEIEIKANTIDKNALLYVSKIAINKNRSSSNVTLLALYEIDILGDNISLSGTVSLKFPVPAGMTEGEIIIGHFHQGSTDILIGNLISGKYVVEVSELSEFGVFSKNSVDAEVSNDDLNAAASGYVSTESSISWAPPEKPTFITKTNTWFDSDQEYDIEWTDSFWTPMIKYIIEEYLYTFDENKDPYTTHATLSDHYTYNNQLTGGGTTFFYRIRAYNTWTDKYSEWVEPIQINLGKCPAPNLNISTHEVNAGEQYTLTWNVDYYLNDYEIKVSFKDNNGNITDNPIIEVPNKLQTALDHFEQLNSSFGATVFYIIEFSSNSWTLSVENNIPGTYYYSIRSVSDSGGCESPWYVDPPESGDVYVEVLPDPSTGTIDAEIYDISVFTEDDPLNLYKWYNVWVNVENIGEVTQNFKITGFGSYQTDFKTSVIFLELKPGESENVIFECKFAGGLFDRKLGFGVYDENGNELSYKWKDLKFVSETIDGDIYKIDSVDNFELGKLYGCDVYIENTGNVAHTFYVRGVESIGSYALDFNEQDKPISLEAGESDYLTFDYICSGVSTEDRTLIFRLYENADYEFLDYIDQMTKTIVYDPVDTRIISLSGDLDFGTVQLGSTPTKTLRISNTGNSSLLVTGITYPSGFSGSWNGTIPAGSYHDVTVTFAPTQVKTYDGTLTVSSNKTSGTSTKSIYGTGWPPPPTPEPTPTPDIDPPTVYTDYAFGIGQTEAYIKCGISDTGGELASMRGVKYRDVTAGGSIQSTGSSGNFDVGQWSSKLTNLTPDHQYEARAYATNSEGTGYGQWITFWTLKIKILEDLTVTPLEMNLNVGESKYFSSITLHYSDDSTQNMSLSDSDLNYYSIRPDIATVNNSGRITGISPGDCNVGVEYTEDGVTVSDSIDVTVN
ncbi:hypothetical protein ES708_08955 [subsurface metagenome]